jgi:dihydrofolate synthase / folylpolyglutamate synthase
MKASYKDAISYIESLIPNKMHLQGGVLCLDRIRFLLELIGNPHNSFRSIHIGGTAGKGSTARITSAFLYEAGYSVGLHTSPHLERINERIQVGKRVISDKEFARLVFWIKPFVLQVSKTKGIGKPTYFEVIVAIAFEYFKRKKVDIAVVEVGLGGVLDATNVISPLVSIITNVHLDHTHILGDTVEKIARDKAGIIKKDAHIITAVTQKHIRDIIRTRCKKEEASSLTFIGNDCSVRCSVVSNGMEGVVFDFFRGHYSYKNLHTTLIGSHQAVNISCAIVAVQTICQYGFIVSEKIIRSVLLNITISARLEYFTKLGFHIFFDGAHSPVKMRALVRAFKDISPSRKIIFIFSAKRTKNVKNMISEMSSYAKSIIFTQFSKTGDLGVNKSHSLDVMRSYVPKKIDTYFVKNPKDAFEKACSVASFDDIFCITGSLYLVGELRKIICRK